METRTYPPSHYKAGLPPAARLMGEDELPPGTAVGRYLILATVGRGGMGTVYAAYDPQVDRKVAIKVLRRRGLSREDLDHQLGEARSLARLAHSNVVRLYDAGIFGERAFLTMEYLQGETLKQWMAARRSWREVVEVFQQAGKGLLAAHRAGLVHGDFKPANVLLAEDGVRVLDFGTSRGTSAGRRFTGAGTPGYMAPEVRSGGSVDERSDQFSFGVSFYEALFEQSPGARPSSRNGRRSDPPGWLRELVERCLAPDPDLRFPSMEALLRALSRRAGQRHFRWRWAVAGLAAMEVMVVAMRVRRFAREQRARRWRPPAMGGLKAMTELSPEPVPGW